MNSYHRQLTLRADRAKGLALLADTEKVLRLGPQWDVKEYREVSPPTLGTPLGLTPGSTPAAGPASGSGAGGVTGSTTGSTTGFELDVEYDRTEAVATLAGRVDDYRPGEFLSLRVDGTGEAQGSGLTLVVQATAVPGGHLVDITVESVPAPQRQDLLEYDLWARSILNYMNVAGSRSLGARIWKRFLDRWWLTMSQSGKRMVFFIVAGEAISLAFLVALLLVWKYIYTP